MVAKLSKLSINRTCDKILDELTDIFLDKYDLLQNAAAIKILQPARVYSANVASVISFPMIRLGWKDVWKKLLCPKDH